MIKSVRDNARTMVAGCVSSGKTHGTAGLILWFLIAFAPVARVFSLAPTERQLKINLWGEIPKMHDGAKYSLGAEKSTLQLKFGDGWYAMGFSPKDKGGVFGMHGEADLLIVDDAQGVNPEIWEALENAMAGGTTRMLASCNPVVTSGEVYQVLSGARKGYNILTITADKRDPRVGQPNVFLAPNIRAGRTVVPGTIAQAMVDYWIDKFGYDSDFVRTKVRALLPKQEPDTLIPIDWLEMATMREVPEDFICRACESILIGKEAADNHAKGHGHTVIPHYRLGVDVARFGDDRSAIAPRRGRRLMPITALQGNDTMQVSGQVAKLMTDLEAVSVNVDVIGIGSGVADRLRELEYEVIDINVGESATSEKFVRLRDEIWWNVREKLDPKGIAPFAIPRDPELIGDLAAPKWNTASDGKIKVESKEAIKKRIGRSPDMGDAACLALWDGGTVGYA